MTGRLSVNGLSVFHLLAARLVETTSAVVDLALRMDCGIQLRDSAGLSPASPLSLPIRGKGAALVFEKIVKQYLHKGYHIILFWATPIS